MAAHPRSPHGFGVAAPPFGGVPHAWTRDFELPCVARRCGYTAIHSMRPIRIKHQRSVARGGVTSPTSRSNAAIPERPRLYRERFHKRPIMENESCPMP